MNKFNYYYYFFKSKLLIFNVKVVLFMYPVLSVIFSENDLRNLNKSLIKDLGNIVEKIKSLKNDEEFEEDEK